jgi:putative Mg2+ transporter-C (MgtC) family protein
MINIELIGEVPFYIGLGIEIVTAVLAGGVIGFERERKMKAAGLRTNTLICLGATLYTAIGIVNSTRIPGMPTDANRIAAQIVSGIGFLGAGAIIQSRGQIVGLTTAATIWLVAAVGVTIGSGYPFSAMAFVFTTLVVLQLIDPIYRIFRLQKPFKFDIYSHGSVKDTIDSILNEKTDELINSYEKVVDEATNLHLLHIEISTDLRRVAYLVGEIQDTAGVKHVHHHEIKEHSNLLANYKDLKKEDKK